MANQKNIAVVGCGHWGKNLVRNFANQDALYAVCDGNAQVADQFAHEYGCRALSFEEVLSDVSVVGVVLATPAEMHHDMALRCLASGKHVYVEKPLALTVQEGEAMLKQAEQTGRILMVGHLLHYHPAYLKLKSMVVSGDLGDLRYVYSNRLSYGKLRSEENVFWSFAPHDISMILGLIEGAVPDQISAHYHDSLQSGIADFATAHLSFPGGLKAHIQTSWLHPFKEQRLVVIGEKAALVFDDTKGWDEKLMLYPHSIDLSGPVPVAVKAEGQTVALEAGEPLANECAHFIACLNGEHAPRTDGAEGLRVLRVLQACDAAAQSAQPTEQAA